MFSSLPPEVITNHIFPFLSVNDLLRLRRVCKASKDLAEDYLRLHGTSNRVIEIDVDEGLDDLKNFLALPFTAPASRFYFWNEGNSSWDMEHMQLFSSLYGGKITHLEIRRLDIPMEPSAVQFFEGLPNLRELRIHDLKEDGYDARGEEQVAPLPDLNLPSTFKQLKHIYVRRYSCRPQLVCQFMEECSTNLERVNHPTPDYSLRFRGPDDLFDWVTRIVERRHHPDKPNLKYLDLANFGDYGNPAHVRSFYELVTTCSAHGVKLQNEDARLIEKMMKLDSPDRGLHGHKISRCVVSIKNLTESVFHLELPFLEEIDIMFTAVCSMPLGDFERQPWENLKELRLCVVSEHLGGRWGGGGDKVEVSRLFEFLFHGIRRDNLESLNLDFETDYLPYPEMSLVCSSCPNLKKLYIYKWPGSDRDIAQLWSNLPLLEHVTFEKCGDLGDAAFIGDDVTRPAIWKATRLKSLTFKGLGKMPGITDALFRVALRHMPLKNLYLESWQSWRPVSSITLAGLESLLTGKFAETIEKFPLKRSLDLEGATDEQLVELERRFRSAQM